MTVTARRRRFVQASPAALPRRWQWLFRKFRQYAYKYAARHLHAVRVAKSMPPPDSWPGPAVVVLNHPSWWDPIIAFILSNRWPDRLDCAPIESSALARYRFLAKVGLFGIKTGSPAGAAEFLRVAKAILAHDHASLWVTAQGQFTDARARPTRLQSGVGHLAASMGRGVILPVALEYPFWDERTPEALVAFGPPIDVAEAPGRRPREWTERIATALETAQDRLADDAMTRDPSRFYSLIEGRAGVGGLYDLGRRVRSWLGGRHFRASHSQP